MKKVIVSVITLFMLLSSVAYADYETDKKQYTDNIAQEQAAIERFTSFLPYYINGMKNGKTKAERGWHTNQYNICLSFIQDSKDLITLNEDRLKALESQK